MEIRVIGGMRFGIEVLGTTVRLHSFNTEEIIENVSPITCRKNIDKFIGHHIGTILWYENH